MIAQSTPPAGFIDLGLGNPDTSLLPVDLLRQSAQIYFNRGEQLTLQYGLEQGDGFFRQALANFLSAGHGTPVKADQLFVTGGVSAALDLVCTLFTKPGDAVLVEEPSYYLALRIFEDHGLRAIALPGDDENTFLANLERALRDEHPRLVYLVPTFQNPSGRTLSQGCVESTLELVRQHDAYLVADEVYHLLWYRTPPRPALGSYIQRYDRLISTGSFSKILAPGLRLGWIQAHERVLRRLSGSGLLDSGGGLSPFTSSLIRDLVESGGLEENVQALRRVYAGRLEALAQALRSDLPQAEWTLPQGGFFCWVRLPGVDAAELRRRAHSYQVGLRQGALFSSRGGLMDYFRLSFSYYSPEEIKQGISRLRECLAAEN